MHSFSHHVLGALVKFLEERPAALFKAQYISAFNWMNVSVNSVALRGPILGMATLREDDGGNKMCFTLFGVIKSIRTDGTMAIGRPDWHSEGSPGLALMVRYDEQLLALAGALESRDLMGSFADEDGIDDQEIILTARASKQGTIGNVVCVTATLSVEQEIDCDREEHYTLNVEDMTMCGDGRRRRGGIMAQRETEGAEGPVHRPILFYLFGVVSGSTNWWSDDDAFLVVNDVGNVVDGAALIATATLLVRPGEHDELEDYQLTLQKIHVMRVAKYILRELGISTGSASSYPCVSGPISVYLSPSSPTVLATMAGIWPKRLDTLKGTLDFLNRNTTASIANSDYNIDFSPPRSTDTTVYTDIDGAPYNFWVFGQVLSEVESQDGRLTFKLGGGDCENSMEFFGRQLQSLALPVREDDDADTDMSVNMQGEPATDWDRSNLSSGTFIDVEVAEGLGRRARLFVPGGPDACREWDAWYASDFAFKVGDWMLVYATLHRTIDVVYKVIAEQMRKLRLEGPSSYSGSPLLTELGRAGGTIAMGKDADSASEADPVHDAHGGSGAVNEGGEVGVDRVRCAGKASVTNAEAVLRFEVGSASECIESGEGGIDAGVKELQPGDDTTLSSSSSTGELSPMRVPAKRATVRSTEGTRNSTLEQEAGEAPVAREMHGRPWNGTI
ncbi:hypothetical protein C8F04DRAFT_1173212 [Mycena alexandri]|uniref:Uncharacterized protein n=1 Tax=Mycena alexandri TaxID=1745969 RepID=A0AAD6TIF8_9AGAR|nr:hypothetical protein C8F04DRAFT_1173212 [Mycena alexandri]